MTARRREPRLDLAGDLPRAPEARARAPLDDRVRQQPPLGRARGAAPERARGRRDRARPPRLARARGAHEGRGAAQGRRAALPRRDELARARHRHGRRRPRAADRVAQVRRRGLQRIGRAGHGVERGQPRADLPEVPRRPAGVRRRRASHARRPDRADRRAAQRARRARPADRRDRRSGEREGDGTGEGGERAATRGRPPRGPRAWPSTSSTRSSRAPTPTRSSRASCWRTCSTCSTGATPRRSSASCARGSCGTASPARSAPRRGARQLAVANAGTIPDRGLFAVTLPDGRRVGELDEEMVYEARPGQAFLLGASTWRIEEIGRDRVIVTPAPGRAGRRAVLEGRHGGAPKGARRGDRRVLPLGGRAGRGDARARLRPRRARGARTCSPTCASSRPPRACCPASARSSLERFRDEIGDWRLCLLSPYGGRVHAAWGLAMLGAHARALRRRVRRHLVRRRHRHAPPRPRRGGGRGAALRRRADAARARRGRAGRHRRARRLGAVRRALSRERRARAADPPRLSGPAHAALAAAPEGAEPARGRAPLRRLPDRARDLPRVPARRARRARAARAAARRCTRARSRSWRSRRRRPRRSPPRCCSTTSPRTCTRATRRARSAAPRRCRSTATCCASCSARRSCAS